MARLLARRLALVMLLPLALGACGAAEPVWAPDEFVSRARYEHPGPPAITLFTMVNNGTGAGEHSGLMINAGQRALFDPAGTFGHETLPERNDVVYGITPVVEDFYIRFHARYSYHVRAQRIEVTPEVAALALRLSESYGAVPKAHCTKAASAVLRQLPGFAHMPDTWFPGKLSEAFGALPGVTSYEVFEQDSDDKSIARAAYVPGAAGEGAQSPSQSNP